MEACGEDYGGVAVCIMRSIHHVEIHDVKERIFGRAGGWTVGGHEAAVVISLSAERARPLFFSRGGGHSSAASGRGARHMGRKG